MKPCFFRKAACTLLVSITLLSAACSPKHYTEADENSVSLYCEYSDANEVIFASSIDQYQYHPAKIVKDNLWEVTVPMENEFNYFYIVDGVVTLPDCKLTVLDDFGSKNCLYAYDM